MYHRVSIALLSVSALILAGACDTRTARQAAPAAATQPPAAFPLPIIELSGGPADIGAGHGRQLSEPIHLLFDRYLMNCFSNAASRFLALTTAQAFEPYLTAEHRAEAKALAGEVKLDERQVLLGQAFLDLTPMTACSTIALPAAAAPDGVARFGRNLDFPALNVADKHTVVFIYHPQGRYVFAAIGWPGVMGVLSGMNEHGLALANMEVTRGMRLPSAMPYPLLYRTLLERCKTVDEAIALLEKTPRQTANNLMLMDAAGGRAVVEITPEAIHVRRAAERQALISTNHQRGEDGDAPGRCRRYDTLHEQAAGHFGRIDAKALEKMLGLASQKQLTLQSMVLEPANRVVYLATGKDATTQEYHRLDLKPYFEK